MAFRGWLEGVSVEVLGGVGVEVVVGIVEVDFLEVLVLEAACCCSCCVATKSRIDFSKRDIVEVESGLRWLPNNARTALWSEGWCLKVSARILPSFPLP